MSKLIVIEGLDGAGKATQSALLCERLRAAGKQVVPLSFPRYDLPGSALVRSYLAGEFGAHPNDVNAYAAAAMYAEDRYLSYVGDWRRTCGRDAVLVADRYVSSNAVYQLPKLERGEWESFMAWLEDLEYVRFGIPRPDVVVLLDAEETVTAALMSGRYGGDDAKKDIHERDVTYQHRCREAALWCAERCGWLKVGCTENGAMLAAEKIAAKVFAAVAAAE